MASGYSAAAYCAAKLGVGAFSEALRQHVRVSVVEPGSVDTELRGHDPPAVRAQLAAYLGDIERLQGHDGADAVGYVVTRPRHVAVAERLVRPTEQV
ncbi:hypothetical protein ACFV30_09965 [Streptomyces sp. NPDC059752]|uniref:hypothetical protein n=1 Tax=unclassified Streptomyces TaxID=2593676 RepID=UPI0036679720